MRINERTAELIGALIGDGHIYRKNNKYRIGFTGDIINDKKYYEYLKVLILKEWNKETRIFIGGRGLRMVINSKEVCNFLIDKLNLPYGRGKGAKVKIPYRIAKDWLLAKHAIRGIADTDGSVFVSKKPRIEKYPCIEIGTTSEKLALQLKQILEKQGFRVNRIRRTKSKLSKLTTNRIILNGHTELKKWMDKIGFSNPYKFERASSYLKS